MSSRLIFLLCPLALYAQLDLGRVLPADSPLHMVAFGDFGSGSTGQKQVAQAMARRHKELPFQLGITMGDNFYRCGVRGVRDKKWQTRWEDLYTPLGIPFYATLGNHDYGMPRIICPYGGASPNAEIARTQLSTTWKMPARYYTFAAGPVRFIAIDTEGWSQKQFDWIKSTLAATAGEPDVVWRVVYGHHPMYTSGVHLNQRRIGALRRELLPVLKAAGVRLYIAGHDHDMERLHAEDMEFFIAGSGGAHLRRVRNQQPESLFTATTFGFLDLVITPTGIDAQFFDTELRPLDPMPLSVSR